MSDLILLDKKLRKQAEELPVKDTIFCVFTWRGDGKYKREAALHEYKTRGGAQSKADKLNATDADKPYVVREIYL